MDNSRKQTADAKSGRVQVGNLPQQEKELKEKDAQSVKGGGGVSGGVIQVQGEEIPQKHRN